MDLTQADLGRRLGVTRSAVNAWEMGVAVPATKYLVALVELFNVSADYLLGIDHSRTMDVSGLDNADIALLHTVAERLRKKDV